MEQSEKRKEMGRPLILCLNTICVLDRGLKVKGLGVFYLSISHQIIRKIIKETVGKADLWGVVWHSGSKGPGQETTLSGTPLCWYPLRALVCNSRTEPTRPCRPDLGPRDEIWWNLSHTKSCDGLFSINPLSGQVCC